MRSAIWVGVVLLLLGGCQAKLLVSSDDHVTLTHPVETRLTFDTNLAPPADPGPVLEMSLGGVPATSPGPKIALIEVDGLLLNQNQTGPYALGDNPVARFKEKLAAAAACADVRAVVLRINSPGGGVVASDLMWKAVQDFRAHTGRPVVACLLEVGTGGAYYLAAAANLVIAHPLALTGGIGVIWNSYNLKDLMAQYNILPQQIKAGANIDMGSSTGPLSKEVRQLLQAMADEFHERFKAVVRQGRPGVDAAGEAVFDGRVFTATQALKLGLIDRVGYLEDAVAAAREAAGTPGACVVTFHRCNDPPHSAYNITPETPLQNGVLPLSLPGLERSRLPTFLYLWQPEPTLGKQ
jgi:protease-4